MRRLRGKFGATTNPLIVIEWIIAIVTLIGGLYLLTPLWNVGLLIQSNSPLAAIIVSSVGIVALASVAIIVAVLSIAGIVKRKPKWRSAGLFANGLIRLYALLAGFLLNGFIPLTWLSPFTLMCITFFLWWRVRRDGVE